MRKLQLKSNTKGKPKGGSKPRKRKRIYLTSASQVRLLLSQLVNDHLDGLIPVDSLRGVSYACSMVLKAIETGQIEKELQEIKDLIQEQQKK